MLKNFIKVRKNPSSRATQQKVAEAKRLKKQQAESDSEYSDSSSDSDYEEILISSMKGGKTNSGKTNKKVEELPPPLKLERQETKPVDDVANHSNHFIEPKSEPIDIPKPKPKSKSKRVVNQLTSRNLRFQTCRHH